MNMKLGEITLYMVGRKFGEEYANRLAEQFTDQEIANYAAEFKKLSISEKRKMANAKSLEVRWGKKQKTKLSSIEISNRKHQFDSSMEAFKQLAALKKEVEVLDEAINSSIQTIIDVYLNTEKETKR